MLRRGIELKRPEQIAIMRRAGLVVAEALAACRKAARPGVTTAELDAVAAEVLARRGATSSFYRYGADVGATPFPAVTCISVNEQIVHGIPGSRALQAGDLVSIDFGAIVEGWHGDSALSMIVPGEAEAQTLQRREELSAATRTALWAGIGAAHLGGRVGDISHAIERSVRSHRHPYGIVEEYTGHGIGSAMHQEPDVPNFGRRGRGPRIQPGLCVAVEPMVTFGRPTTATLDDDWTVVTSDGSDAAHWEHTITATRHGLWVLTAEDGGETDLAAIGAPFGPLAD